MTKDYHILQYKPVVMRCLAQGSETRSTETDKVRENLSEQCFHTVGWATGMASHL